MLDLLGGFGIAALPALPILLWLRHKDRAQPEPLGLIARGLLLGFLAVAPAALLEFFLLPMAEGFGGLGRRFIDSFLVAGLVEEGLKLAFLRRWLWKRREFDEAADGIVYAVSVSLGFAVVENFLYTWHHPELLVLRSLGAVPLHALATGQMGFWLGLEKLRERRALRDEEAFALGLPRGGWARGLAIAVIVHGTYDFLLLGGGLEALLVVPLLLFTFLSLRRRFGFARRFDVEAAASVDSLYGRVP